MATSIRINFLDGLRGLAILLVLGYHTYARYTTILPYGDEFALFPLFSKGFLGVQLFFLLSGFVILMTLERSKTFSNFLVKRWLRLFPAMLLATTFIVATLPLIPERAFPISSLSTTIPGLFFVEPEWIRMATGIDVGILEVTFWSLYVEMKFYIIFGLLFFYFGERKAIAGILIAYLTWLSVSLLGANRLLPDNALMSVMEHLSFKHFGWFCSGSLAYLYYKKRDKKFLLYAFLVGLLAIKSVGFTSKGTILTTIFILLVFIGTVYIQKLQRLFTNKFLLFFGFISYPLYLIHENMLIALIIKLNNKYSAIPHILLPVLPLFVLTFMAYVITRFLEPSLQSLLKRVMTSPTPSTYQLDMPTNSVTHIQLFTRKAIGSRRRRA